MVHVLQPRITGSGPLMPPLLLMSCTDLPNVLMLVTAVHEKYYNSVSYFLYEKLVYFTVYLPVNSVPYKI